MAINVVGVLDRIHKTLTAFVWLPPLIPGNRDDAIFNGLLALVVAIKASPTLTELFQKLLEREEVKGNVDEARNTAIAQFVGEFASTNPTARSEIAALGGQAKVAAHLTAIARLGLNERGHR